MDKESMDTFKDLLLGRFAVQTTGGPIWIRVGKYLDTALPNEPRGEWIGSDPINFIERAIELMVEGVLDHFELDAYREFQMLTQWLTGFGK